MGTNRITGMYSGLDTESLISSLVEAKKTKVTAQTKKQMKIKYQQDAWKDLNKKVKNLYSKVESLRYESSFTKRKTEASDSSVADIETSDSAMLATQTLKVKSLAKSAYLTGGKIDSEEDATSATLVKDLGIEVGTKFNISVNGKDTEITIGESTTMASLASQLSKAGVSANFDANNQRFYIGAKKTGEEGDFSFSASDANGTDALSKLGLTTGSKKIDGKSAEIELNGVSYKSNENTFNINGLTITAKKEMADDEEVTLTTMKDTSAIYDKIKDVIKTYSELINEMDGLYNASTKTKYEPLTDEEKSAMSDYEIEKWEENVKKQCLAKDENIYSISSKLKSDMQSIFKIGDKNLSLSDFGIETAPYLTADENEKYALHIYGDEDDSLYSTETNKLKELIASDTDSVVKFFSSLGAKVYESMNSLSSRVANTRSYGSFYDDLKLQSNYSDYTDKIEDMEDELADYEDKWYDKFSAMETALAKLQSNQTAISGLFS